MPHWPHGSGQRKLHTVEKISVIIPVINESRTLEQRLPALQCWREAGHEVIVVDGGSTDGSADMASRFADRVLHSEPGRAAQMNRGADAAVGDILLFLHIDTVLPEGICQTLSGQLEASGSQWGRFDIRLSGDSKLFRLIARMMNWRSRLTGVATGDQAIFVRRAAFIAAGGYEPIPLMEDIALSKQLRRLSRPLCIRDVAITSSRRWEKHGTLRTVLLMWSLRLAYFLGVSPERLHHYYYGNS